MFRTCFWAGDIFAPKLKVKNNRGELVGIQTFLQSAFLDMFAHLSQRLGTLPSVLGFECLNEPHPGYINLPSLHQFNYFTELHFHDTRTIPALFDVDAVLLTLFGARGSLCIALLRTRCWSQNKSTSLH